MTINQEKYRLEPAEDTLLGGSLIPAGLGAMTLGAIGLDLEVVSMDSAEAQIPPDALGSVNFADKQIFVGENAVSFGGLVLAGAAVATAGWHYLDRGINRRRSR